ncbi:ClpXP protease specificity-enhancing factor [Candidatus Fukatsuia symbiotica]|uniref:ClpXP protease specificity-enhancing factor n=1 Tax=Candidatus Fukatsuia TaxID=1927833 RepID=UPI000933A198|nr:ClpXP protease specificity-enhancing factor [Candidatus Fukatsuia symbiotica]MEA9444000.1 ClpXP protease specificity-enhancing factor [Candidatus Fukatsuia symbiotica]
MKITSMRPRRPYLLRAFYDWLVDNELTPYLLVDTMQPHVQIPQGQASDNGRIVLNIGTAAVGNLKLGDTELSFQASFNQIPCHIKIPIRAVLAIYAQENGVGTEFEPEDAYNTDVEVAAATLSGINSESLTASHKLTLINGDNTPRKIDDNSSDDDEPPRGGGRPALRVIK